MMLPQRSIEHQVTGLSEMLAVKPAYEDCAQVKEDCLAAGCCAPSGYNCFKNARGQGRCMRECTPGGANGTCEGVAPHMKTAVEVPGLSLFCFSVYTENTGSDKVSHELELLQMQHDKGQSLFSCAEWAVYSDVVAPLGGGDMTIQVEDTKGDWHLLRRKDTQSWVNTGMFVRVWKKVQEAGHYRNHNWVIKVDADAVFFPVDMVDTVLDMPDTDMELTHMPMVDMDTHMPMELTTERDLLMLSQRLMLMLLSSTELMDMVDMVLDMPVTDMLDTHMLLDP